MLLVSAIDPAIPNVSVFTAGIGTLQNVLYLENKKVPAVVVGGRNALYKLSTSLQLEADISTGPELDHPSCSPSPGTHCEQERTLTDNENQVLVQLGSLPLVLACGSLWQGTCNIHKPFGNLSVAVSMDRNLTVNYVASRASTVAFFGTGNQAATLFAASTYDDRPVNYHPFAVSGRDLDSSYNFKLHWSDRYTQSFINVASEPLKKSYRVHYIYGMSHRDFVYFVTVQNSGRSLNTFETRLARVCQEDPSFLSYTEIPVSCEMEKQRFGIATAASADPTSTNGEKVLVIAFGKPYGGQMHTGDPRSGSAVCYFEMGDIVRAFETAVTNCNAAKQTSKLSRLYTANPSSLACTQYTPVEEGEFCTPGANNYIEGQITLNGAPAVYLPERLVTSVTMMRQHETSVAWIGDNTGFLHKYKLIKGQPATFLFSTDLSDGEGTPIERSTAVEPSGMFAYFLTGRKVRELRDFILNLALG